MGRHKNTTARRAQIVDGLLDVMSTAGYTGASVQSIARAAGLSPGLLHYHFSSKQEILLALMETLSTRLQERFDVLRAEATDPWDVIGAWIDAHLALGDGADPRAVACWVQIGAEALRQPVVRDAYRTILHADVTVLTTLLEDAGVPDAPAAASGLMASVQGTYQLSLAAPEVTPPGRAAEIVRGMATTFRRSGP